MVTHKRYMFGLQEVYVERSPRFLAFRQRPLARAPVKIILAGPDFNNFPFIILDHDKKKQTPTPQKGTAEAHEKNMTSEQGCQVCKLSSRG